MKILIAEDEKDLRHLIKIHLIKQGFEVAEAEDGAEALNKLDEEIDLVILDIMMPKVNGLEVLKELRRSSKIPVLMLTARGTDSDKILGLGLGADDYMVKPINPMEVVARVEAQLRRAYDYSQTNLLSDSVIENGDLRLEIGGYTFTKAGNLISLNAKELKILELLMTNLDKVFTKKQIYEKVWGEYYLGDDNTVMVHISHIRDKIEDDSKNPRYLKTIRGLGYKMESVK
ncbi:response regulator transcription factor [Vallitalea okinawensis]|uniref:response regulator transcription factor n=1 Tax=Vallitalea okinawensis TaxID=2078660 RepID=UPI000CFA8A7A|nr:response regulator transcription factor [Vallitalea okinawensis]